MTTTKIINLPYSRGTDEIPSEYIKRDAILNQKEKGLNIYDILLLEGDEGIGKKKHTLLQAYFGHSKSSVKATLLSGNETLIELGFVAVYGLK